MYKPRFKGSHYDMGNHYGKMLRKNGVDLTSLIQFDEQQTDIGKQSLDICKRIYPEVFDEINGMSDGLEVNRIAFGTFLITAGAYAHEVGCSTFAYSQGDKTYFVRNHDMFVELRKITESALYKPDKGNILLAHGDALIGKEDRMDQYGLAVGMNFVAPKEIKPGLNFLIIVRMLLEKCRTVDECVEVLCDIPSLTSHCILMADKTGKMAVAEMCPDHICIRYPKQGQSFIISTNHFQHPEMRQFDNRPEDNWYHTVERYETIEKSLNLEKEYSRDLGIAIASGKKGFVCQYSRDLKFDTLWSVSYDLSDLSVKRADGNPSRATFKFDKRLYNAVSK